MEEMVLLTIITRSKESARQTSLPVPNLSNVVIPRAESPLHDPIPSVSFAF